MENGRIFLSWGVVKCDKGRNQTTMPFQNCDILGDKNKKSATVKFIYTCEYMHTHTHTCIYTHIGAY